VSCERVAFQDGGFVHAFGIAQVSRHALPLHKLVVPLSGTMLQCCYDGRLIETRQPLLVAAGVAQTMRANGPAVAIFEPALHMRGYASRTSAELTQIDGQRGRYIADLAAQLFASSDLSQSGEVMQWLRRELLVRTSPDARVSRLAAAWPLSAAHTARPSLSSLAEQFGVSSSRLSHLFAADTGVSLRAWLSLSRALYSVQQLPVVSDLAQLASVSGFADQPHMTRVWKRHFGRTPTDIRSVFVQDAETGSH